MIDPIVTVLEDRRVPGADSYLEVVRGLSSGRPIRFLGAAVPLSEALATEWRTDAHVVPYVAVDSAGNEAPLRINKRGSSFVPEIQRDGGRVEVRLILLDHDLRCADGEKGTWTDELLRWFVSTQFDVAPHVPSWWYTTRHGSRFVFVLSRPVDPLRAERIAAGLLRDFSTRGIFLDNACSDWTRLFRLPRTVREDAGRWWAESPYFVIVPFNATLDPDSVTPGEVSDPATYASGVEIDCGERPDEDRCREILYQAGAKGNPTMTDWHRRAKRQVNGSEAYPVCFEHVLIDDVLVAKKGYAGWNDALLRIVGSLCGLLVAFDDTTPAGIYALLREPLEQMTAADETGGKDWCSLGWSMVCRIWEAEVRKAMALREEERAAAEKASAEKKTILDHLRTRRPDDVPADEQEARTWLERRMIASDGHEHRIMREDGCYTLVAYPSPLLAAAIRDLGVEHLIRTRDLRGNVWALRPVMDILTDHAIPVSRVRMTACEDVSYISGRAGDRELVIPIHRLDDALIPARSDEVDRWLRAFFGSRYEDGVEWLGQCLKVHRPIPALNLYGASGAGKNLLVKGIAECFRIKRVNDGRVLSRFNFGLAESPVINFDEGVPGPMAGCPTADQAFRVLVSGGNLPLEQKGKDVVSATVFPRLIFTSNDLDVLAAITGSRDLSDDDIAAIEARLVSIRVSQEAANHLIARGSWNYTSRWVGEKSEYVLARHILYLHHNSMEDVRGTGRFLMRGDRGSTLLAGIRMQTEAAQAVVRIIIELIESNQTGNRSQVLVNDARVWALPGALVSYAERRTEGTVKLTSRAVGKVLRALSQTGIPKSYRSPFEGAPRGKWYELDTAKLIHEAVAAGIRCERLIGMFRERHGDAPLGTILEAANE